MSFRLLSSPLEKINLRNFSSKKTGAFTSFQGIVRDHNHGRKVRALEYQAYEKLCQKEAQKILQEAFRKFDVIAIKCFHRVGKLKVGDIAVWVGVSAAHRDAAFKACRYLIDEIKSRLPIWKKEYYVNGDSGWVNCDCNH